MEILVKKTKRVKYYPGDYCQATNKHRRDYRLAVLMFFFVIFALIMMVRLFKLQIIDNDYYIALASDQHEIFKQLYPARGSIYVADKEGELVKDGQHYYPMATSKSMYLLYAIPKDISEPEAVLSALRTVFEIKTTALPAGEQAAIKVEAAATEPSEEAENEKILKSWEQKLMNKEDPYEPLKHLVSESQINQLKNYNLAGLFWTKEITRYYPEKNIGSQLLGFVGKQAENNMLKGYYGLEGCYDAELAGDSGFLRSELDTLGRWIAVAGKDFRQAEDGGSLVLTIDKSIQYFACNELNKAVAEHNAESGSLIVLEPTTGRILAMCNAPDFDPNEYNKVEDMSVFKNRSISESYEPGSVYKPITMAMAINSGLVDPFSGYNDTGEVRIADHTIRNSDLKAHGWQTMTQVLEQSLNTGAVFVARKVGLAEFRRYSEEFGFGKKTGIDLCSEDEGNIASLSKPGEIYLATASFGQGITATPIQMVRAFAAIVNEGKLVQPYLIDSFLDSNGQPVKRTEPKVVSQVISPQSAKLVSSMLVSVIKNGHTKIAAIPGYLVGGKTGTAQVPDTVHGGYSDKTIHTFIGFAPFNQPRFVILAKIDKPATARFAESTAAPLFSKVGKYILDYLNVPKEVK